MERLNTTPSPEDTQDLNDILTWVITSTSWPDIKTVEAVLFLENGEVSLVPLEEQIRDKYSALLDVTEYGTIKVTSGSIIEYLCMRAVAEAEMTAIGGTAGPSIQVSP